MDAAPTAAPAQPAARAPRARKARADDGVPQHDALVSGIGWFTTRLLIRRWFGLSFVNRHHIPKTGPALIIPNHPCYLDPFIVGLATRRWITWMAWEEAFSWPGLGTLVRRFGALPVNLEKPAPSTFKTSVATLRAGHLLGMFFEGQRSRGYDLDPPKRGGARLALMAGCPVVPVSVAGARRLWPLDKPLPVRPGAVTIRYHAPIDPASVLPGAPRAEREEKLTNLIADAIRSGLPPEGRHRW